MQQIGISILSPFVLSAPWKAQLSHNKQKAAAPVLCSSLF